MRLVTAALLGAIGGAALTAAFCLHGGDEPAATDDGAAAMREPTAPEPSPASAAGRRPSGSGERRRAQPEDAGEGSRAAPLSPSVVAERAERAAGEGEALDAPEKLDAKYQKSALSAAFARAAKASSLGVEIIAVDCAEYPCIVIGQLPDGPDVATQVRELLAGGGFEAYDDAARKLSVWSPRQGAETGSSRAVFMAAIYPQPDEDARGEAIAKRLRFRTTELLDVAR